MKNNTITVKAYFVNGSDNTIIENSNTKDAIENYFLPDMRPPVQTIVIEAKTHDGKFVTLSISPSNYISAKIIENE